MKLLKMDSQKLFSVMYHYIEKTLLLIVDDGNIDNYTFAFPILEESGMQVSDHLSYSFKQIKQPGK